MGGSIIGELTKNLAEVYANRDVSELLAEDPEFWKIWSPSELGRVVVAAFNNSNQDMLDAISQHAFTKAMDCIDEPRFVQDYVHLYRQSEDYIEALANRGEL
jgi:HD superfamily phosphohydrolase YqeK